MKHLNPDLDNITTVDLKGTPSGGLRYIGVDSDNQIVQVPAPGQTTMEIDTLVVINQGEGFYFDTNNNAPFTSGCWAIGREVVLTANFTSPANSPHNGIAITGTIQSVDELFSESTMMFDRVRITVDNAQNHARATEDAFDGRTEFGGVNGAYEIQRDDLTATPDPIDGEYTLSTVASILNDRVGVGYEDRQNLGGLIGSVVNANRAISNTDTVVYSTTGRNNRPVRTWVFWGWDTEEDGSPVVHPDTGIRSIVVGPSLLGTSAFGSGGLYPSRTFTGWNSSGTTGNAEDNGLLVENPSNPAQYGIVGGSPYITAVNAGSAERNQYARHGENNDFWDPYDFATTRGTSRLKHFGNTSHTMMSGVHHAGGIPMPNTTNNGDRTPSGTRGTRAAQQFFTLAPASTNTGLNYIDGSNNQGWHPLFSVVSNSGAVRASDGRYYLNANPEAPIISSSPLYDPNNPTATAVDGIYLTGDYVSNRTGAEAPDASWQIGANGGVNTRLNRIIYRIDRWTNAQSSSYTNESFFTRVIDRVTFCSPEQKTEEGDNVIGTEIIRPQDPIEQDPLQPSYTIIQGPPLVNENFDPDMAEGPGNMPLLDNGQAVAEEANSTLTFEGGDNITIEVTNNPDIVRISATDNAAITNIQNILDGSNVIDVSEGATPRVVPEGDIAWVSPDELYVNISAGNATIADPPSGFNFEDGNWLRIGADDVAVRAVVEIPATVSVSNPVIVPAGSIADFPGDFNQYWNNTGNLAVVTGTSDFTSNSGWTLVGDGNTDTPREHTQVFAVDTTTAEQTITINRAGGHELPLPSTTVGYTVQCYEEITDTNIDANAFFSLFLPRFTRILSNGNVQIVIPQNTINGNVKIEIRA